MERLTHEADFGLEDWEETLFFVKSDPTGAYDIIDIARHQGESEFDEILKNISLRLAALENILGDNYEFDRLRELVKADREGRCAVLPVKLGHEVWIVERDEDGEPECVTGYVFLAKVKDYVIVAGFLNGSGDVDEILKDQAVQTLIEYNGDLPIFSACDCYLDKESALKAMKEREDDDRS